MLSPAGGRLAIASPSRLPISHSLDLPLYSLIAKNKNTTAKTWAKNVLHASAATPMNDVAEQNASANQQGSLQEYLNLSRTENKDKKRKGSLVKIATPYQRDD